MKKTVNEITSILIIILFVVISYSNPVKAAKIDYTEGTFKYVLDDVTKTAEIFDNSANKSTGNIVIPEKVTYLSDQYIVTMIGESAFYDNKNITSVVMPDTITSLGERTFENTSKLTHVDLSKNLTTIPKLSFEDSNLSNLVIPEGVITLDWYSFSKNRNLKQVKLPSSLKTIAEGIFRECNLSSIEFPQGLKTIGQGSFAYNLLTDIVIPESVDTLGNFAFEHNKIVNFTLSKSIKVIQSSAFNTNKIEELTLPEHITELSASAFRNNNISEITFLNSDIILPKAYDTFGYNPVKHIFVKTYSDFDKLFRSDNLLKGFDAINSTQINLYTLDKIDSSLKTEYKPGTQLSYNLIQDGHLTLTTGDVSIIPDKAFDLKTKSYVTSDTAPYIMKDATIEWYKESTGITKSSDTLVGTGKDLTLSNVSVNDRGSYYALINGVLKLESIKVNVKINSSVNVNYLDEKGKSIAPSTTINGLSSEPYTTTSKLIGGYTLKTTPNNHNGTFEDEQFIVNYIYTKDKIIYSEAPFKYALDEETKTAQISDNGCTGDIVIPDTITYEGNTYTVDSIADKGFYNNKSITSVIMPDSILTLGINAFDGVANLIKVTFSKNLTSITSNSFMNTSITKTEIPENVTKIESGAFNDSKIKDIIFLNSNVKLDQTNSPFKNNPIENIYVQADEDIDKLFNTDNLIKGFDGLTNNIINLHTINYTSTNLSSDYSEDTEKSYILYLENNITLSTSDITKKASKAFDLTTKSYVPSTLEPIVIDDATIEWYKESTGLTKSSDTLVGTGKDLTLSSVTANDRGSYYALINGVLKLESIKVNVKINSSVKVNYLDEQGKSIAPSTTINGLTSELYTTTSIKIDGYTLKTTPTNYKGTIEDTQIVVDYVYAKDKVEVTNKPDIVDNTDKDKLSTSGFSSVALLSISLIFSIVILLEKNKIRKR